MSKKIVSLLLVLSMLVGMLAIIPVSADDIEWDIVIENVDQWMEKINGKSDLGSKNICVTAKELDFSGKTLTPITNFSGLFDGKGVVLKNITMSGSEDVGLFCTSSGTYQNIVITDSSFTGTGRWVAPLLCCTNNNTKVYNIYVSKTVVVTTGSSDGTNTGTSYAGGIIGIFGKDTREYSVEISDCVFAGTVTALGKRVGGIVGSTGGKDSCHHDVSISNCLVLGKTMGKSEACGFVGYSAYGYITMTNCIYAGGAEGEFFQAYPLFRDNAGYTVTNCYTTHACSNKTVYRGSSGGVEYTAESSGVTYLNEDRTKLIGLNDTEIIGFTRRADDIMVPNGVADFAPAFIVVAEEGWSVWDGSSNEAWDQYGSGTEEDPYLIKSASQWANLAQASASGIDDGLYFKLDTNLDFANIGGLTPISPDGKQLQLYFDGNDHTIKNVKMSGSKEGIGLFGDIWGSTNPEEVATKTSVIKNLVISSSTFTSTKKYIGAVVGETSGTIIIENIYVDKDVVINGAQGVAGGIVGGCYYSSSYKDANSVAAYTVTIRDCVFAGNVIAGGAENGGILGFGNCKYEKNIYEMFHIVIEDCLVTGNVQVGQTRSSGFVGRNEYTVTFGEGEEAVTYNASVTLNRCIYAGGAEDVAFNNRPFVSEKDGDDHHTQYNVTDCYTTHTAANGVYANVKWTKTGSGVKLVELSDLMGSITLEGWTKRDGDIMVPNGVSEVASTLVSVKMLDGASVRLKNPTGLRFTAVLGKAFLDSVKTANEGKTVTYGIMIVPTSYVEEANDIFTVEELKKLDHTPNYLLIPAEKLLSGGDDAGYYEFSGVITNIDPTNYGRNYSARAYVAVDGVPVYYSEYHSKVNSRSIATVAEAAYNDTSKTQSKDYPYAIFKDASVYSPYPQAQRDLLPAFYENVAINLMSYNVRNVEGGDSMFGDPLTFEYDGREAAVVNYILASDPDVIGLQEVSTKTHISSTLSWFTYLGGNGVTAGLTANGYACYEGGNVLEGHDNDKKMYNPIYYKTDKYTLIESGYGYQFLGSYSNGTDTDSKGCTWVTLEDKTTGERFIYVNVHMPRYDQANAAADFQAVVAEIATANPNLPIFIGGDFNGSYSDYAGYKGEEEGAKAYWGDIAVSVRDNATYKTNGCSTTTTDFSELGTSTGPIDLYYMVNGTNVKIYYYAVIDNKNAETEKYPSDHLPVRVLVTLDTRTANGEE